VFKAFGGRTRRNSGIITTFPKEIVPNTPPVFVGTKRPCSTIADLPQPARICPVADGE